jgi:hypothetical protein
MRGLTSLWYSSLNWKRKEKEKKEKKKTRLLMGSKYGNIHVQGEVLNHLK